MSPKTRHRLKIAAWLAGGLVVLSLLAGAVLNYWVVPQVVRLRLQAACAPYWDGSFEIDEVEASPQGRIRLRGVRVLDREGRTHAAAKGITLFVRDLTGKATLTDVFVEDLDLYFHRLGDTYHVPYRNPDNGDSDSSLDLKSLRIRGRSLFIVQGPPDGNGDESQTHVDGGPRLFHVVLTRDGGPYDARISLPPLSGKGAEEKQGLLSTTLTFHGRGPSLGLLRGPGHIAMRRVDARESRWTHQLFSFLSGEVGGERARSDVEAVFALDGSVVIIKDAVLADPVSLMRVEEDGMIDLNSGRMDLYLITLHLRGLSGLVQGIPLVNMVTMLTNKLTRVHVTGTWDKQVIRKEPVQDLTAATWEILAESLRMGGQIGPQAQGAFWQLFRALDSREEPEPPTQAAEQGD